MSIIPRKAPNPFPSGSKALAPDDHAERLFARFRDATDRREPIASASTVLAVIGPAENNARKNSAAAATVTLARINLGFVQDIARGPFISPRDEATELLIVMPPTPCSSNTLMVSDRVVVVWNAHGSLFELGATPKKSSPHSPNVLVQQTFCFFRCYSNGHSSIALRYSISFCGSRSSCAQGAPSVAPICRALNKVVMSS